MTSLLQRISNDDLANLLGLSPKADGRVTIAGVADLCRIAVWRWGLCPQAAVTRCVLRRLEALQFGDEQARALTSEAIRQLVQIGDIASVRSNGLVRLARVQSSWIRLGGSTGALVGTVPTSTIGSGLFTPQDAGVCRRFPLDDSELRAALQEHMVLHSTLNAWIGTPGFRRSLIRLGQETRTLESLWPNVVSRVDREGLPLAATDSVAIVAGSPGEFFGRPTFDAATKGRWTVPTRTGVWLGRRRGYDEKDLRPIVIRIDEHGQARICDLYDDDEFGWCLLSRGVADAAREQVALATSEGIPTVRVSCPLPSQLRRILLLYGEHADGWTWRVSGELKDALIELLERFGLVVSERGDVTA